MPYVNVHIDVEDVIGEASEEELREELMRRLRKKDVVKGSYADFHIPAPVAKYTLEEAADIFRKQGRYDLAFKLEEIKVDFVLN